MPCPYIRVAPRALQWIPTYNELPLVDSCKPTAKPASKSSQAKRTQPRSHHDRVGSLRTIPWRAEGPWAKPAVVRGIGIQLQSSRCLGTSVPERPPKAKGDCLITASNHST